MFEWIYDRSYKRNQRMLAQLDIAYTEAQHKDYVQRLKKKKLEPMSLQAAIAEQDLFVPVDSSNCDKFQKDWEGSGNIWGEYKADEATKQACCQNSYRQAVKITNDSRKVVDQYAECLSEAVEADPSLYLLCERDAQEITISRAAHFGFITNGFSIVQTWSIAKPGVGSAPVIA